MLSHENIVANFSAILHHLVDYRLCETDTLISYLPLGHMFERVCEWGVLAVGGKVGYFSGDIKLLSDDMKIIQPTMFPCKFSGELLDLFFGIYRFTFTCRCSTSPEQDLRANPGDGQLQLHQVLAAEHGVRVEEKAAGEQGVR